MEYNLLFLSVTDSLIVYPIATFACFDFGYNSNRLSERLQLSLILDFSFHADLRAFIYTSNFFRNCDSKHHILLRLETGESSRYRFTVNISSFWMLDTYL